MFRVCEHEGESEDGACLVFSLPRESWNRPVNSQWLADRAAQKRKPTDAQQATAAKRVKVEAPEALPANGHPANITPGQHLEQPPQQPVPQVKAVENFVPVEPA